jgi:4'-phosphopantetheinyl transferase
VEPKARHSSGFLFSAARRWASGHALPSATAKTAMPKAAEGGNRHHWPMPSIDSRAVVELSTVQALAPTAPPADLWMNDDERQRLATITSEQRRKQFLAGHWLLRRLVAEVHGDEPGQWSLSTDLGGAPRMRSKSRPGAPEICASLSHSGDWLAAAIAPFPIGIDLEHPAGQRDLLALADAAFSPQERAQLRELPDPERAAEFYLYWTIKESVGKRVGHGLRTRLARRQTPSACAADEAEVHSWQFADCTLALAGATGMSVCAQRLPAAAARRFWRVDTA